MKKTDYDAIMNEEIRKRLQSSAWNFSMASRVMEKKLSRRRYYPFVLSFAPATAMLVLVVFLSGIKGPAVPDRYDRFVMQQIQGTYDEVFAGGSGNRPLTEPDRTFIANQISGTYGEVFRKDAGTRSSSGMGAELITAGDVDSLIDDVLVMR